MKSNKFLKILFSLFVSAGLLYLLFSNIHLPDIPDALFSADLKLVLLAFGMYTAVLIFRTLRFRMLLREKKPFSSILPVVLSYNFLNYVVPFRLGEASYVYLMKKKEKISYSQGLSSLVMARVFDFIVIVSVLFLGLILSGTDSFNAILPFTISLFVIITGLTLLLISFPERFLGILKKLMSLFRLDRIKFISDSEKHIESFIKHFNHYRSKKVFFSSYILSVVIFFLGFLTSYFIILSLGHYIPVIILLVVIPLGIFSGVIPVNGIAGFGTFESLWVLGLLTFGYNLQTAVVISFSIHVIQLGYVSFLGLLGWLGLRRKD